MFENIKGAIFDLDGTLIDSMWVWSKIDFDYLNKRGIPLPEDLEDNIAHLSFDETAKYFKNRFNLSDSIEDIKEEWSSMAIHEYSSNIPLKKGVEKMLQLLKMKGIKIGLATSNSRLLLEIVLKRNNVYEYFDAITTTDEVKRGKDFPDIYLLAAERLGIAKQYCVVFEDILAAVIGAKSAGMKVVAVEDAYSSHHKADISKVADIFISDYLELMDAV